MHEEEGKSQGIKGAGFEGEKIKTVGVVSTLQELRDKRSKRNRVTVGEAVVLIVVICVFQWRNLLSCLPMTSG